MLRDAARAAAHELAGSELPDTARLRALQHVLRAIGPGDAVPCVPRAGWGLLADVIRSDRPLPLDDADLPRYHAHLVRAGAAAAREVAELLAGDSLLDLGGGAGAYTAAFLDAHPGARATLVDRAPVIALAAEQLRGRSVACIAGDAREVAVAPHDVVLLANVLHLHGAAACAELCAAAGRAVAPGGTVAIVDLHVEPDRSGPLAALLFALGMAIYTEAGDVHDAGAIARWLADAGLVDVRVQRLASDGDAMLVRARRPALDMPLRFRRALGHALLDADAPTAAQLRTHYTEAMPAMRARQLAEPLMTMALDWDRLPRLAGAIARLEDVLADAGVEHVVPRARTLGELYRGTYYGAFMPMFGFVAEPELDRYLTAPVLHELCHLGRDRPGGLEPLHLDECVAGWLGVHVFPDFAYSTGDDAIYAAPWLAQVGQAFARAFGVRELIRAHAGVGALPAEVIDTARRLGRAVTGLHLLADTFEPRPWVALALAAGAGRSVANETYESLRALDLATLELPEDAAFDRQIAADARRAMQLETVMVGGTLRARRHGREVPVWIERGELTNGRERYWLPPPAHGAR